MKFQDEYRDRESSLELSRAIRNTTTRPWTLMEVCGGQTHAIVRFGIDQLLPPEIELVHGPGCPVCVTPVEFIDRAIDIARRPGVIFCSFGDMLRVPGTSSSLADAKAAGADVRFVYSPLDAVEIARSAPNQQVVFFAVGFETTAPANAMAVFRAAQHELRNFSVLVSQVLVPPAMEAILASPENRVHGFLAAGHVCTVMGYTEYEPIAERYRVPIVVTGFEPLDILHGIYLCVRQLEEGRSEVENQYSRSVDRFGNASAQQLVRRVFQVTARKWRGIGDIPHSGLGLTKEYARFDAQTRFDAASVTCSRPATEASACRSGEVLRGLIKPDQCPSFGAPCTPTHPLGATMVSDEGACAAYYRYGRARDEASR